MEISSIKKLIEERIKYLNAEWSEMVNGEERVTGADYLRIGAIEGAINALTSLLVEIDRFKPSDQ